MQKVLQELGEDTSEPRNGKKGKTKSAVRKEAKMKTIDKSIVKVVESVIRMAEVKEKKDEKRNLIKSETCDLNMNKEDAQAVEMASLMAKSNSRQEELTVMRAELEAVKERRRCLLEEQKRSREEEELLRSRLVEEQGRSARVEGEHRSRLAGLRARNQQLEEELRTSQQAAGQPARPSVVSQQAMLPSQQQATMATTRATVATTQATVATTQAQHNPLPSPTPVGQPASQLTPAHGRLVARLVARPSLAGTAAAEVGRLVARVREKRGGLTGLGVEEIAGEVRRLGREEECPVCLDTMVEGELTRCTRCRQRFHSRWGMGSFSSKLPHILTKTGFCAFLFGFLVFGPGAPGTGWGGRGRRAAAAPPAGQGRSKRRGQLEERRELIGGSDELRGI